MQRTIRDTFVVYKHIRGLIYSQPTNKYSRKISHVWYTSPGESQGMLYSYATIHRESGKFCIMKLSDTKPKNPYPFCLPCPFPAMENKRSAAGPKSRCRNCYARGGPTCQGQRETCHLYSRQTCSFLFVQSRCVPLRVKAQIPGPCPALCLYVCAPATA